MSVITGLLLKSLMSNVNESVPDAAWLYGLILLAKVVVIQSKAAGHWPHFE